MAITSKVRIEKSLALSMRMLAFHFLEAALPASLSNSVGLTVWPPVIWTWPRWVKKVPRALLHTTRTRSGAWAALCTAKTRSLPTPVAARDSC